MMGWILVAITVVLFGMAFLGRREIESDKTLCRNAGGIAIETRNDVLCIEKGAIIKAPADASLPPKH